MAKSRLCPNENIYDSLGYHQYCYPLVIFQNFFCRRYKYWLLCYLSLSCISVIRATSQQYQKLLMFHCFPVAVLYRLSMASSGIVSNCVLRIRECPKSEPINFSLKIMFVHLRIGQWMVQLTVTTPYHKVTDLWASIMTLCKHSRCSRGV